MCDFARRVLFTCGEEKEGPKQCGESLRRKHDRDNNFLQNSFTPDYVASCNVALNDVDPDSVTSMCFLSQCIRVDLSW